MSPEPPFYYSPKELAAILGLSTKTELKRIAEEEIAPICRMNRRVIRTPKATLDNYIFRLSEGPGRYGSSGVPSGRKP